MRHVVGGDEASYGNLAGSVFFAMVILDPCNKIEGLNDSKQLSEERRNELHSMILEKAFAFSVQKATVEEINELNVLRARDLAAKRCLEELLIKFDQTELSIIIDGKNVPDFGGLINPMRVQAVVKADAKYEAVSAASILAKVAGDAEKIELDKKHPQYLFAKNKGYGTAQHIQAIREHGLIPGVHRNFNIKGL